MNQKEGKEMDLGDRKGNIKELIQKTGFWKMALLVFAGVVLLVFSLPSFVSTSIQEVAS